MDNQEKVVEEVKAVQQEVKDTKTPEEAQEINWRKFREQREIERKEKEAADRRAQEKAAEAEALKVAMASLLNKPQAQEYQSNQEETEEQRINRLVKEAVDSREATREAEMKRREHADFPNRLASTYSDFNNVCSTENLDYLEYHYPEVAGAFKHAPDGFDKWSAVYKAVKRFVPNTDSKKDQNKAEKNLNKPQSMASPGVTATGDGAPMTLDSKKREDNWNRMRRVMKGI